MAANSCSDRPRRNPRAVWRELDGDCVVYRLDTENAAVLNSTAAFMLALCDGQRTRAQIIHEFAMRFSLTAVTARKDVDLTLLQLRARGFLEV